VEFIIFDNRLISYQLMYKPTKLPSIDREIVFQLVSQKKWEKIIEVFKNNLNYDFIYADSILKSFIDQYFIDELLTKSSLMDDPAYKYYLQNFYMLHDQDKFSFALSSDNYKKLIIKIVEVETELARAYEYACIFPEEEICANLFPLKSVKNISKVILES